MAASQTPTILSQEEEPKQSQEGFNQLLSSLPREDGLRVTSLYQYQGFWYTERALQGMLASQHHFEAKDSDVIVVSTPKAGTTWIKALVFAVTHRTHFSDPQHHPLLTTNSHKLVPFLENELYANNQIPNLDTIRFLSPAVISTHMPYQMLPESIKHSNCKIVYFCRDPKDVFVSFWHFLVGLAGKKGISIPLEDALESFCAGVSAFGPFWEHAMEYWKASSEKPQKVLFLKYEDLKRNPTLQLKGMAEFLGFGFTSREHEEGLVEDLLNLCSFENLSSLEVNKKGALQLPGSKALAPEVEYSLFFRRGEVGDWKNHLTTQMAERLDQITKEKFQGLGLTFEVSG